MNTDIAGLMAAMNAGSTRTLAQYAMIKKQNDMETSLIDMLASAARSAPPPQGQGLVVDKLA